ncbi:MAG: cell division protein FtsQ/DivIB [Immundisolibacter sp.]|uniref:cell division protein FtsQ/DivIB n=1 Tax=Immundisolibacter sp. TaxID=1934948 RepID=UPI003EE0D1C0
MFRAAADPRPLYQSLGVGGQRPRTAHAHRRGARVRPPTLQERLSQVVTTARQIWVWLRRLGLVLVLASAAVGANKAVVWLSDPSRFPLTMVEITGDLDHIDRNALELRLLPAAAGGFFGVNVAAVSAAARDEPWVKEALVRRVWPDKLVVEIVGRRAIARWGEDGLLGDNGEVFAASVPGSADLPLLVGPPGAKPKRLFADYQRFGRLLEGLAPIRELHRDARGALRIRLADDLTIIAGRKEVTGRLQRFAAIYRSRLVGVAPPLESVDLRYGDGFAVRFKAALEPNRKIMDL